MNLAAFMFSLLLAFSSNSSDHNANLSDLKKMDDDAFAKYLLYLCDDSAQPSRVDSSGFGASANIFDIIDLESEDEDETKAPLNLVPPKVESRPLFTNLPLQLLGKRPLSEGVTQSRLPPSKIHAIMPTLPMGMPIRKWHGEDSKEPLATPSIFRPQAIATNPFIAVTDNGDSNKPLKRAKDPNPEQKLRETLQRVMTRRGLLRAPELKLNDDDSAGLETTISDDAIKLTYEEFCDRFPHVPTPCQLKAVEEISNDFQSTKPMNRVLIGSVGFGKTEVALRAAYKLIKGSNKKLQVVIIAPNKALVEQHYKTFADRFENSGIKVVLVPGGRKRASLRLSIEDGTANIIIGTQAVFAEGVKYKDIGLIIIDEEQKFGVAQKSTLVEKFSNSHVMWMTGTPIPRTAEMINKNIMTQSKLETKPEGRLAIKSKLINLNDPILKASIESELARDGQVYFVVSEIEDLERFRTYLGTMFPDVSMATVHGQMPKKEQAESFDKFKSGTIKILIATTVIEVGIDIPNANLMFIYHPTTLGMATLAQLRGRVGRSNKQAYCFIVLDPTQHVHENMSNRLDTFVSNSELGDDYKLAQKDLETRGAGELYSGKQKGGKSRW